MRSDKLLESMTRALSAKLMEGDELAGQVSFDQYQKDLKEKRKGKYRYETKFHLECPVNNFEQAYNYLLDDDMVQYLDEDESYTKDIGSVEWILEDEENGKVVVTSHRQLTDDELNKLSSWISGQNSDGLGEGFEQQSFAECYYNPVTGEGPYTYSEAQREIERLTDDITANEIVESGELNDKIWDAVETYKEENEDAENMTDDEVYDIIANDVESYIDWEDIEDAKYELTSNDPEYNENEWYNMASFDWKYNDYTLRRVDNIGSTQESRRLENKYKLKEARKTLDDVYSDTATEALWDEKFKELVPKEGKADTDIGEIMRCFASMSHTYLQNGEIITNMQRSYLKDVWDLEDVLKNFGDSTLSGLLDKMYNTRSERAYDHYMAEFYEYFVNKYLKDKAEESKEIKQENEKETSDLMDLLQQVFDNEDDWEIEEQGDEICVRYINDEYRRVCSNMDSSADYDNEDFDTSKEYSLSQLEKIKKDILESVKEHIEYYNDSNNDYKDYCGGDDPDYDQSNWNSYYESNHKEIVSEATNLQDMRNSYIDSFKNRGYEDYKSGDNFVCLIDKKDQPVAVMFYGKAGKPTWHYRFRNMEELDQYINNYLGQKDVQAKIKANRRAERKITKDHDVKVGDIFVSNWGYEQTNIEFYEVVDVKGSRIYLKELANEYLDSDEYTCDKIMPKKGQYVDDEVHTMSARANGTFTNLDGASYMTMYKWNGKPQYPTNTMFGH